MPKTLVFDAPEVLWLSASGVETNRGLVSLKTEPRVSLGRLARMLDLKNPLKSPRRRKLVVLALLVLSVVAIVTIPGRYPVAVQHSKEAVLKTDLQTMRDAIEKYTADNRKPPASLQDLVDANYLRAIPVDPITIRRDWVVEFGDVPLSPNLVAGGIIDVHSSSTKISLEGTRFNTW